MSYMPAELDDDDDCADEFLGYAEDIPNPKSQTQTERFFDVGKVKTSTSTNEIQNTDNLQRIPVVNNGDFRPHSSRMFPHKPNNLGESKKKKASGASSLSSPFLKPSSQNVLTEEDLKTAVVKGSVNVVQKCLYQGLSINEVLPGGWTPLMYASNHSKSRVVELLLSAGADPSYHVDMYTPLMCACTSSSLSTERLDCVKMLVTAGADVNARDRHHSTGLMLASRLGYLDLVDYLIEKGAKVNEQDSRGWTALTWSVQRGHKDVTMTLLDSGADCSIKHADRLTVKDMAAHMPTDEMLALLEKRPVLSISGSGDMTGIGIEGGGPSLKQDPILSSQHSVLDQNDSGARSTDLRYGEMEIFLLGLDLPHLVPLFQKHLIDLYLLLDMTEQDLINAGVEQVGARKKILDASQAVHKKNWEVSSLVSVHFNKQICCSDALAMVANVSKHIRYINSTVVYIGQHLKHHPNAMVHATDRASPTQLVRHVADTSKHVQTLQTELSKLQESLIQEMKNVNVEPPDLIPSQKPTLLSWRFINQRNVCISCGFLVLAAGLGYVWQNGQVRSYLHSFIGENWHKFL